MSISQLPKSIPKTSLVLALASGFALAGSSDWRAPASAANRPNPVPVNADTIALGQQLYVANYLGCHGPEGKGNGSGGVALEKKPANLGARIRATGEKDGELFWKMTSFRIVLTTF